MTGHQWQVAGLRFVAMIISFTLMVVLAKTHGLNGLACASAIGNVLLNFFLSFAIWRYMKIRSFARGIMVANISALLAILCFFLTRSWVGSFGAAGFFLLAYLALVAKSIKKEIESGFDFQKKTA
jgi:O-antigen/teichoic acid export membrane protein